MKWKLTAIAALAVAPSLAMAQNTDTTMRDTTMRDTSRVETSSEGRLGQPMNAENRGLSSDQVKQLQQAINDAGCSVGSTSGTFDSQTLVGVNCVRQKKSIQSDNLNDVLRALNLSFTATDSLLPSTSGQPTGQPTYQDTTSTYRDTTMMHGDTTMQHDTTSSHH